jgi:RecJ-like exonuclease
MDCVHCGGTGRQETWNSLITKHCYECNGTGKVYEGETVKDVMYNRMISFLESWTTLDDEPLDDAIEELMRIAFDTCKISEKEQNEDWRNKC